MKEQKENKGFIFRLGENYLRKKIEDIHRTSTKNIRLTVEQKGALRKVKIKTLAQSAFIGAFFVLLAIIPFHTISFFQEELIVSIFDWELKVEMYFLLYVVVLLPPEIWLLKVVNMRAVKQICEIYEFPPKGSKNFQEQIVLLTEAGLEVQNKHMQLIGIDPYIGLSKFSYYALFIFAKLKASLSNVLMKFLLKRLLGRYALRIFMDLAGAPIYAFWNAWASYRVIKEARIRITSSEASKLFLAQFSKEELLIVQEKVPELANFIAQLKRAYDFSLYAYIHELTKFYPTISLKTTRKVTAKDLFSEDAAQNEIIAQLLVFGIIVDGTISVKERLLITNLSKEDWFPITPREVDELLKLYLKGE